MLDLKALDQYLIDHKIHGGSVLKYTRSCFYKNYHVSNVITIEVEQWHTQNHFEFFVSVVLECGSKTSNWYFKDSCYNYNYETLPTKIGRCQSMLGVLLFAYVINNIQMRALGFVETSGYTTNPTEFNFKE